MAKNLRSCVRCGAPIGKTLAKLSKRPTQCPSCRAVNYVKTIDGVPTQLAAIARITIKNPRPPDDHAS
jgi:phage FluMu protein Com